MITSQEKFVVFKHLLKLLNNEVEDVRMSYDLNHIIAYAWFIDEDKYTDKLADILSKSVDIYHGYAAGRFGFEIPKLNRSRKSRLQDLSKEAQDSFFELKKEIQLHQVEQRLDRK